jgi:hypothetical protein
MTGHSGAPFLQPGHVDARALLRRGRLPQESAQHEEHITGPCPWRAGQLGSLLERFRLLLDPCSGHGLRHRQPFVLACTAVATLMGGSGYQAYEDTCQKLTQRQLKALGCQQDQASPYSAPSDRTFFRVLTKLDPAPFESVVGAWLLEQEVSVLARLAVDSKVLRGSGRIEGKPLQLLAALRNLALGLCELEQERGRTQAPSATAWCRQMTAPVALALLGR